MSLIPPLILTVVSIAWVVFSVGRDRSLGAVLGVVVCTFAAGIFTVAAWLVWGLYAVMGFWQ